MNALNLEWAKNTPKYKTLTNFLIKVNSDKKLKLAEAMIVFGNFFAIYSLFIFKCPSNTKEEYLSMLAQISVLLENNNNDIGKVLDIVNNMNECNFLAPPRRRGRTPPQPPQPPPQENKPPQPPPQANKPPIATPIATPIAPPQPPPAQQPGSNVSDFSGFGSDLSLGPGPQPQQPQQPGSNVSDFSGFGVGSGDSGFGSDLSLGTGPQTQQPGLTELSIDSMDESTKLPEFNKEKFKVSVMENVNSILEGSAKQCDLLNKFFYPDDINACEIQESVVIQGINKFKAQLETLLNNLDVEGILISDEYNRTLAAFICQKILDNTYGKYRVTEKDLLSRIEFDIKNLIISLYIGFIEEYNSLYKLSEYIDNEFILNVVNDYYDTVSVNSYKGLIPRSYILSTYYNILFETKCAVSNDKTQLRSIELYIRLNILNQKTHLDNVTYSDGNYNFNGIPEPKKNGTCLPIKKNIEGIDQPGVEANKYSVDNIVLTDTPSM